MSWVTQNAIAFHICVCSNCYRLFRTLVKGVEWYCRQSFEGHLGRQLVPICRELFTYLGSWSSLRQSSLAILFGSWFLATGPRQCFSFLRSLFIGFISLGENAVLRFELLAPPLQLAISPQSRREDWNSLAQPPGLACSWYLLPQGQRIPSESFQSLTWRIPVGAPAGKMAEQSARPTPSLPLTHTLSWGAPSWQGMCLVVLGLSDLGSLPDSAVLYLMVISWLLLLLVIVSCYFFTDIYLVFVSFLVERNWLNL